MGTDMDKSMWIAAGAAFTAWLVIGAAAMM